MKKKTLNTILAAGAMVVLSAGVIVSTNIFTGEKKAKQEALDISGYTSDVATLESAGKLLGSSDEVTGYTVTVSSVGFNAESPIVMDVTFDTDAATVTGITIVDQKETDGLGANIATDEFAGEFNGIAAPVYTADMDANGTAFDQVTGASFSSKAVANGINAAYEFVQTVAQ